MASARPVSVLDRSLSLAGALTASDEAAGEHDTVLIPSEFDPDSVGVLLDEADRVVALVGNAEEAGRLGRVAAGRRGAPPRDRPRLRRGARREPDVAPAAR